MLPGGREAILPTAAGSSSAVPGSPRGAPADLPVQHHSGLEHHPGLSRHLLNALVKAAVSVQNSKLRKRCPALGLAPYSSCTETLWLCGVTTFSKVASLCFICRFRFRLMGGFLRGGGQRTGTAAACPLVPHLVPLLLPQAPCLTAASGLETSLRRACLAKRS